MKKINYVLTACLVLLTLMPGKSQTAARDNKVAESITFHEMPGGRDLYGIFEGRTPCLPISHASDAVMPPDCDHLKWQVIFF